MARQKNRYLYTAGIFLVTALLALGLLTGCTDDAADEPLDQPMDEEIFDAPDEVDPFADPDDPEMEDPAAPLDEDPLSMMEPEDEAEGFEQARPHLEQQLQQQRQDELLMDHIEELRDMAEVETNLDDPVDADGKMVVAVVNGEHIYDDDLRQMEQQELQQLTMMGLDPDSEEAQQMIEQFRPQILENLIAVTLIKQASVEAGIEVSEDEVEAEFQQYAQQTGGEEALQQQLDEIGLSLDDLKDEIRQQLPTQKYLEQFLSEHLSDEDLQFSEEELREAYEQQLRQQEMMEEQGADLM